MVVLCEIGHSLLCYALFHVFILSNLSLLSIAVLENHASSLSRCCLEDGESVESASYPDFENQQRMTLSPGLELQICEASPGGLNENLSTSLRYSEQRLCEVVAFG